MKVVLPVPGAPACAEYNLVRCSVLDSDEADGSSDANDWTRRRVATDCGEKVF